MVTLGPSTFGFGHRIGSLRIYFGSSLDLSDSSLILEIGLSSEILRISRPFTHPVPFPLSPPLFPHSPFPFLPPLLGCLLISTLTRPPLYGRPSALPLRPSPRPYACPFQVVFEDSPIGCLPSARKLYLRRSSYSGLLVITHYLLLG